MHKVLRRQLGKILADGDAPPSPQQWAALLSRVSRTYADADQDRYMLERSLDVSSREMRELYEELRKTSQAAIDEKHARLEESLALAHAVQESVADGILVVGDKRTVVACNKRFTTMWLVPEALRSEADYVGLANHIASQIKDQRTYLDSIAELMKAPDLVFHHDVELLDGRIFERYAAAMRGADGTRRGWIACYRDVTEPRRLTAQRVVVAERMAAVGQLVASVAHEINNPLCYIAGNVDHVKAELKSGASTVTELVEALEDARIGVERIRVIVRDLCTLSRVEEESGAPTDIQEVLTVALQMASNHIRHRARVARDFQPVPKVSANEARLAQVFLNLLVNAAHAIPEGRASENTITVATRLGPPGRVRIEIRDTGCGIDRAHLERIFDPFFTTKPLGSGTGLGLSICKGLITKMGGEISVESRAGEGSCFAVELPIARAEEVPAAVSVAAEPAQAPSVLRRCVLVVDDDAQIRRVLVRALRALYDVEAVASVDEALLALGQRSFEAVLCDIMMPNRTGLDLHTAVTASHPAMVSRLVFMSGGAFTPALQAFFDKVPVRLEKPLDVRAVCEAIERVAGGATTE
jgi:signal transduction histidine kinase/ActR/RegA family two-component response regulator